MIDEYDAEEGSTERKIPCNQISLVLHDHDVMNTCCYVNPGSEDEYNGEAPSLQARVRDGLPIQEALRATLIEWFGEIVLGNRSISALSDDVARVFEADGSLRPVLAADTEHREELLSPEHPSVFSQTRFVALPTDLLHMDDTEQVARIRGLIQEHHHFHQGSLESGGRILRYMFFDAEGRATQYTVEGQPLGGDTFSIPAN